MLIRLNVDQVRVVGLWSCGALGLSPNSANWLDSSVSADEVSYSSVSTTVNIYRYSFR